MELLLKTGASIDAVTEVGESVGVPSTSFPLHRLAGLFSTALCGCRCACVRGHVHVSMSQKGLDQGGSQTRGLVTTGNDGLICDVVTLLCQSFLSLWPSS